MTPVFLKLSLRYANIPVILIGLAVVSSILLYSGCGMTSSSPNPPVNQVPTPTPDRTPPTVTSFSSAAGAVNVTVTFSEAMDQATLNTATIVFQNIRGGTVPATMRYDANSFTVTLEPTAQLSPESTYSVLVKGGGTDPRVKD